LGCLDTSLSSRANTCVWTVASLMSPWPGRRSVSRGSLRWVFNGGDCFALYWQHIKAAVAVWSAAKVARLKTFAGRKRRHFHTAKPKQIDCQVESHVYTSANVCTPATTRPCVKLIMLLNRFAWKIKNRLSCVAIKKIRSPEAEWSSDDVLDDREHTRNAWTPPSSLER
jgi:hypothetical protein